VGGAETAVRNVNPRGRGIPHFDLDVRTRSGARMWVNVSTILFDNRRRGRRLLVQLARDIGQTRLDAVLFNRMLDLARQVIALTDDTSRDAPADVLTDHERRILRLFAEGNTAKSISRKLNISAQTLRNHVHRINRKLGTQSRLEAVTRAQRRGLIK
jgi:DNA-binding CsgD family transcriptional regulator